MNLANLIQRLEHAPRPARPQGGDVRDAPLESIDLYVQADLDRLEQTWSEQERLFVSMVRRGQVRPPSRMHAATILAIGAFLAGMLLAMGAAAALFGMALLAPAALLSVAVLLGAATLSFSRWQDAADYERFMKAYEAYRDMLLADCKQMVAERVARESRRLPG